MSTDKIKTVGIVASQYKVARFEKELLKADFKDYTKTAGILADEEITVIKVLCEVSRLGKLTKLIQGVEFHFKNRN